MINKKLKVGNVPNLRFPGFEGDWKQVNLGECSISLDYGMNAAAKSYDGVNKYIRITDIDESSSRYKYENPVSPSGSIDEKYLVGENEILFARTGASTGKSYLYHNDDGKIYFAGFLIRAKIKNQYNSKFIFSQTQTEKYSKWVQLMSMRSGQPGINSQEYSSFKFFLPLTKAEQDKIASFLSVIDKRIYTQNKIIKQLQTLIKGVSKKLFSQKIRFIDFTEKWEMKTFGKIATFYSGGTPLTSKKDYFDGNIPFIRSGEINSDKTEQFISELGLKNSSAKIVEVGDILYALYGATSGEVGISRIKGAINQAVLCIRSTENHYFLYSYLVYKKESIIKTFLQGGQGNLSADIVKQLKINLPSLEEQRRIASFLSKIHQKIQTEEAILEQLNNQKQYLLKQLFV